MPFADLGGPATVKAGGERWIRVSTHRLAYDLAAPGLLGPSEAYVSVLVRPPVVRGASHAQYPSQAAHQPLPATSRPPSAAQVPSALPGLPL